MKKRISIFFIFLGMLCLLASCSMNENYAAKIRKANEKNTPYSYAEVIKKLGDPTEHRTSSGTKTYPFNTDNFTGFAVWYVGYNSEEEYNEAYNAGKKVKSMLITFEDGYAVNAMYSDIQK